MPDDTAARAAANLFAALKAFDSDSPELTIAEVAGRAGLDRCAAFGLVHTLRMLGYLAAVSGTCRFRLTLKCLELGYTALTSVDLQTHARPLLTALVPDVADAASLGMLDGPDVVCIERVQAGLGGQDLERRIGSRIGAYGSAPGQAMLAYLSPKRQIAALETSEGLSERTLVDLDPLTGPLALVRERGYAVSDRKNAKGLRTVAAPVLDPEGAPVASVSLTIRAARLKLDDFLASAAPEVVRVSKELGRDVRLSFGVITRPCR